MRFASFVSLGVLVACGSSGAKQPDARVFEDAPASGCTQGTACSTNPGAPCLTGSVMCQGEQATCLDSANSPDGTTCSPGTCTRGTCLAPATINANIDLSTTIFTPGRACAEAPAYNVVNLAASTAMLTPIPDAGCLTSGDEVLLISLQGAPGAIINVGNWELLEINNVTGSVVTFKSTKTRSYGFAANGDAGIGVGPADQKVALVRVPNFGMLAVTSGVTVTTSGWNGLVGGVLAIHAATLNLNGALSAAGLGYRGGESSEDDQSCSDSVTTQPGESIAGPPIAGSTVNNVGAPGGIGGASGVVFAGNPPLNSGASHATVGGMGGNGNGRTIGGPGAVYGVADASQLTMGSGYSGNMSCRVGFPGPSLIPGVTPLAGGIVLLISNQLNVGSAGAITASANNASRDVSASGGYVFLRGSSLSLGNARVTAVGGVATGVGGTLAAGDGYIVVSGTTVTGTTRPTAHQL
jgi:hypothetical protein